MATSPPNRTARIAAVGSPMRFAAPWCAIALLFLATPSCLYSVTSQEHTFRAVNRLEVGMTGDECLAALDRGGAISVESELAMSTPEERAAVFERSMFGAEETQRAVCEAEAETGRPAARTLLVHRYWGFMGYAVFQLFLDADDRLVLYRVQHYN